MTHLPKRNQDGGDARDEGSDRPPSGQADVRLQTEADVLAAALARLRVLVSAPTSCDVLLEEIGAVRNDVDRFACELMAAFLDAQLDRRPQQTESPSSEVLDSERARRFVLALSRTVGRFH